MVVGVKINPNDGIVQIVATGGQTDLDFDFPLYNDDHITIIRNRAGTITTLTKTTDYTIAAGELEDEDGGVAVLTAGATAGDIYTLLLNVPEARTTDYNNAGDFDSDTLNREFDLQTQMIQQLRRDVSKSLKFADSSTTKDKDMPEPEDGKVLGWDGTALINYTPNVSAYFEVSPFMETVLDDANAGTARETLGLVIGTDVQAHSNRLVDVSGLAVTDGGFIVGDGSNFVLETGATARASLGIGGAIQQIVEASTSTYGSTTNNIPLDNTAPQNTEGAEALSQAFTPVSASSTIYIFAETHLDGSVGSVRVATICNTGVANCLSTGFIQGSASGVPNSISVMHSEASGSTSARTYSVRYGATTGTCYVNGSASDAAFGGTMRTRLRIIEVL